MKMRIYTIVRRMAVEAEDLLIGNEKWICSLRSTAAIETP